MIRMMLLTPKNNSRINDMRFLHLFIYFYWICRATSTVYVSRGATAELRSVVCFASPFAAVIVPLKALIIFDFVHGLGLLWCLSVSSYHLLNSHHSLLHCRHFPQSVFQFIEQSSPMKQFSRFPFSMFAPKRFIHRHNIIITTNKNSFKKEKKKNRKWNEEKSQTNYEEKMYVMLIICLYCEWALSSASLT